MYWVDSNDKTLRSADVTDSSVKRTTIPLSGATGDGHVFGLVVNGNKGYVTCWSSAVQLIKVDLTTSTVTATGNSLASAQSMFSAVFVGTNVQSVGLLMQEVLYNKYSAIFLLSSSPWLMPTVQSTNNSPFGVAPVTLVGSA